MTVLYEADSLYMTDKAAYHEHVHNELMRLGFSFRRCLLGEIYCGARIKRHYWKKSKLEGLMPRSSKVEQAALNRSVAGSNPVEATKGRWRETSGEYDVQKAQTPVDVQASATPSTVARANLR